MLDEVYLSNISNDLVDLIEQSIITPTINDMARRISRIGLTESSIYKAEMLKEAGMLEKDILKRLANSQKDINKEIEKSITDSVNKSVAFDNRIFTSNGKIAITGGFEKLLIAGITKTKGDIKNFTMTTAKATQKAFIDALNTAYMQVSSGLFDVDTATRYAIKNVARTGLKVITYEKAVRHLESGIRTALITGVQQTTGVVTEFNCNALGVNLVETTAHAGARLEHADWQGQVFSLNGNLGKYRDFKSATGYGDLLGIKGINCRHDYYPYFEGDTKGYAKGELAKLNAEKVKFNDKEYSLYEANQVQRKIERNIRKWKREAEALQSEHKNSNFEKKKIKHYQKLARDFSKQTGIRRKPSRELVR